MPESTISSRVLISSIIFTGRPTGDTTITAPKADTSTYAVSPSIPTATDLTTGNTINTVSHDNAKSKGK